MHYVQFLGHIPQDRHIDRHREEAPQEWAGKGRFEACWANTAD